MKTLILIAGLALGTVSAEASDRSKMSNKEYILSCVGEWAELLEDKNLSLQDFRKRYTSTTSDTGLNQAGTELINCIRDVESMLIALTEKLSRLEDEQKSGWGQGSGRKW